MAAQEHWHIRKRGDVCAGTGTPFVDGEEICTRLLFKEGEYLREDYAASYWDSLAVEPGLSTWHSIFHIPPPPEEAFKKESAESLLHKLVAREDADDINAIYILAVMLERKKIIIEQEVRVADNQTKIRVYRHKKSDESFLVTDPELKLAELEKIQEEVVELLGGKPPKTKTVYHFEAALRTLLQQEKKLLFPKHPVGGDAGIAQKLAAAFLVLLSGKKNPRYVEAKETFSRLEQQGDWKPAVSFFRSMLDAAALEIRARGLGTCAANGGNAGFAETLENLAATVELKNGDLWPALFPEGADIRGNEAARIETLRAKRTVEIETPCADPVTDPANELLFTANVLLTVPAKTMPIDSLPYRDELKAALKNTAAEKQKYWFDHPIQIGVKKENNELLYGLRGLAETLAFEKERGTAAPESRLSCVLSVSATHNGLRAAARDYIRKELGTAPEGLDLFAFTEADTHALVNEVLAPAAKKFFGTENAEDVLQVFGIDGEYGRHYSFLKAVAALLQVVLNPSLKGVFKTDLDQIFPQEALVAKTGKSAFEHFADPLWGAKAEDAGGNALELGMIAGALVNEADIKKGLFIPDVPFPSGKLSAEEQVFFSRLPQALSTEAEMMARGNTALQRIHVTGGTNGIRIDALRRHRPFTPSFIGRGEDQAYLLSAFGLEGARLAYTHASGLIMRHDKEAFASEAIKSAQTGTTIGDYIRTLYFTAYARALNENIDEIKDLIDPFTGAFISHIPQTVVSLRLAFKTLMLVAEQRYDDVAELLKSGTERLSHAVRFVSGKESALKQQLARERRGWNLFYDVLENLEAALAENDPFATTLKAKALDLIESTRI